MTIRRPLRQGSAVLSWSYHYRWDNDCRLEPLAKPSSLPHLDAPASTAIVRGAFRAAGTTGKPWGVTQEVTSSARPQDRALGGRQEGTGDRLGSYGSVRGGPAVAWGAAPPAAGEGRAAGGGGWRRRTGAAPRRAGSGPRRDCSTARPGGSCPSGPARPSLFLSLCLSSLSPAAASPWGARKAAPGRAPAACSSFSSSCCCCPQHRYGGTGGEQRRFSCSRAPACPRSGCGVRPPEGPWGVGGWAARCHCRVRGCGWPGGPAAQKASWAVRAERALCPAAAESGSCPDAGCRDAPCYAMPGACE